MRHKDRLDGCILSYIENRNGTPASDTQVSKGSLAALRERGRERPFFFRMTYPPYPGDHLVLCLATALFTLRVGRGRASLVFSSASNPGTRERRRCVSTNNYHQPSLSLTLAHSLEK